MRVCGLLMGRKTVRRVVRALGRVLAALLAALVLATSPLWAGREAESSSPLQRLAPALFFEGSSPGLLLVRIYANAPRDDEFVEIANSGPEPADVSGWSLTDREATASFPLGSVLPAGGRLLVTRNSTSYAEDTLLAADFTFDAGDARRMEGGVLRLADAGDEVLLLDPSGAVVDAYAWGDSAFDGPGWTGHPAQAMGRGEIAVRATDGAGGWVDRDVAEDWEGLRHYRLAQSAFDPLPIQLHGATTAVLSPDEGDIPLLRVLASAQATIEVSVYTFTSERIASALAAAAKRGVWVRVLLEGAPVGGVEKDEHRVVGGLLAAGADVRWLAGAADVVKRYRYLHAKYAIVDAATAWIGSENFGDAGFPAKRVGNRGWSVIVEEPEVASGLRAVFEADFDERRRDSIPAAETTEERLPDPPPVAPWSSQPPSSIRMARLLVSPDTALDQGGVLGLFAAAKARISLEAFYLEDTWRGGPNPFLEAAFAAARRGVSVRILLDGSWSSTEADSGTNDDVLARISARATNERLTLEVRLLEPRGPIERLHNKGAVVDGRTVLVSSMNWALGSATENREVGLVIEDAALSATFEAAFNADWEGRPTSGGVEWRLEDPLALAALYAFVGIASAVSLRKLRAGAKGTKPRGKVRTRGLPGAPLRGRRGEVRILSAELVAQPRTRARGRPRTRRRRTEARDRVRGSERD